MEVDEARLAANPDLDAKYNKIKPYWWPTIERALYGDAAVSKASWSKWGDVHQQIVKDRQAAVSHRETEQVETLWYQCEELYVGVDDVNRGEHPLLRPTKGHIMDTRGVMDAGTRRERGQTQSKLFIRIGARYIDAAKAKIGELAIPVDGKFFKFYPTPFPTDRNQQPIDEAQAHEQMRAAEQQIHDWLVEGHFTLELRKVIADSARLGVGVLKGPEPMVTRMKRPTQMGGRRWTMQHDEIIRPVSRWVNAWNFFPAPSCGEDIHHGDYCLERDYYSTRQLEALLDHPAYMVRELKSVIMAGPSQDTAANQDPTRATTNTQNRPFEVWFYHGQIPYEQLRTIKPDAAQEWIEWGRGKGLMDRVPVKLTLINDMVVSCSLNPILGGDFPYDTMPWERRPGSWVGIGIAEQLFAPSKLLQSATRAMIRNAGNSSGSQIVMDQTGIAPADGDPNIYPDKLWTKSPEALTDDVAKAFQVYEIPSRVPDLLRIIDFAMRIAEESTNIPLVTQGYGGKTQPETYGGMQLLNNNATQLLREIGANMDHRLLEPHLRRYYTYFIEDPGVPDEMKGDWQVQAVGTSHLIERPFQDQLLLQMGQLLQNPSFRIDPAKWFAQLAKGHRIDPNLFTYSEEEYQKLMQQQQPPPEVQVQQMRNELEEKKLGIKQQKDQQDYELGAGNLQVQAQRDASHAQSMENTHLRGMMQLQLKFDEAMTKQGNEREMALEKIKTDLAKLTMELNVQERISERTIRAQQVRKPKAEPAGRAKKGHGYAH